VSNLHTLPVEQSMVQLILKTVWKFIKKLDMRGRNQIWYIWYIIRTFANTPMYPHPAQQ
jgi:hypothetical protein